MASIRTLGRCQRPLFYVLFLTRFFVGLTLIRCRHSKYVNKKKGTIAPNITLKVSAFPVYVYGAVTKGKPLK